MRSLNQSRKSRNRKGKKCWRISKSLWDKHLIVNNKQSYLACYTKSNRIFKLLNIYILFFVLSILFVFKGIYPFHPIIKVISVKVFIKCSYYLFNVCNNIAFFITDSDNCVLSFSTSVLQGAFQLHSSFQNTKFWLLLFFKFNFSFIYFGSHLYYFHLIFLYILFGFVVILSNLLRWKH